MRGKGAADQGPEDDGKPEEGTQRALGSWALLEGNRVHHSGNLGPRVSNRGLRRVGNDCLVRVYALTDPARMPAAPTPAKARPMMSVTELGDAPQMAEPTSKSRMLKKRTTLGE